MRYGHTSRAVQHPLPWHVLKKRFYPLLLELGLGFWRCGLSCPSTFELGAERQEKLHCIAKLGVHLKRLIESDLLYIGMAAVIYISAHVDQGPDVK